MGEEAENGDFLGSFLRCQQGTQEWMIDAHRHWQ